MRYDQEFESDNASAADILNNASEFELGQIFKEFGEERYANVLAKKVIQMRSGTFLGTPTDFKNVIKEAFPRSSYAERNKVTKRAFQAVRIAVNQELLSLKTFLEKCPELMEFDKGVNITSGNNSLLMILTFHSLEESMVMAAMTQWKRRKLGQYATKKFPILPSEEELEENSRSKSAKMYSFLFGPEI